ncbi:hypothetical protein [Flavobacterium sp. MDT1-60]|uniref:hypothetical protein n=1 Tax=Flavobacterium sp. MDT1-60 TaxID=1979344 RepID=UPI00178736BE|nr:hypothetical protein [Flavobacterium sp. MDT1-60]QOG03346.1 hypothetical protein IHE43_03635 [Flavobacterium sp. MDT1-60]
MIRNYTFDEAYKRFEPHDHKCTYCGEAEMENMNDCYFVPLFVEGDRTNIVVYRSVKYSKVLIGIPRCRSCKDIHYDAKNKAVTISVVSVIILLGLLLYNFMNLNAFVFILGIFATIFGGIYGSSKLAERYVANKGIYTLQDGAETNEVVQDLVIAGWSFTMPTA